MPWTALYDVKTNTKTQTLKLHCNSNPYLCFIKVDLGEVNPKALKTCQRDGVIFCHFFKCKGVYWYSIFLVERSKLKPSYLPCVTKVNTVS